MIVIASRASRSTSVLTHNCQNWITCRVHTHVALSNPLDPYFVTLSEAVLECPTTVLTAKFDCEDDFVGLVIRDIVVSERILAVRTVFTIVL